MPTPKTPSPRKPAPAAAARKTAPAPKAPAAAAPAPAPATAPTPSPTPAAKAPKLKQKLVRDSFAMPAADFELIHLLKERALTFRRPAKKSELLRAGLHALAALPDARLRAALDRLSPLKPGRPKNEA